MKKTTVAILGSRGIPNRYGGFEELAEHLSTGLVSLGYDVFVYNVHNHPCPDKSWKGVHRLFCRDPENIVGPAGQFIYDLNCINDSRKRKFDVIIQLGYTSSSIWHRRLPSGSKVITNMDGLEWKREKYSHLVRRFLKYAEKLAVYNSHALIADNIKIQDYLQETYQVVSDYIPYGADIDILTSKNENTPLSIFCTVTKKVIPLKKEHFFLLIARLQPDNHIEEIIQGVLQSKTHLPLVVIGNHKSRFGKKLAKKHASDKVIFAGGMFQPETLHKLRNQSRIYFHGHSAGGTNPSLLQAMAASAFICAHNNPFNRSVLGEDGAYFTKPAEIASIIDQEIYRKDREEIINNNIIKIKKQYNWKNVICSYESLIQKVLSKQQKNS